MMDVNLSLSLRVFIHFSCQKDNNLKPSQGKLPLSNKKMKHTAALLKNVLRTFLSKTGVRDFITLLSSPVPQSKSSFMVNRFSGR